MREGVWGRRRGSASTACTHVPVDRALGLELYDFGCGEDARAPDGRTGPPPAVGSEGGRFHQLRVVGSKNNVRLD